MTNLNKLVVSLTKHGAHKVADLLVRLPPDDVIKNTWGSVAGINIDAPQARKVLSAHGDDTLPEVWHEAKLAGQKAIEGLVLLAIVFSHHKIIQAMRDGSEGYGVGRILRGEIDGGKGFTNLKDDFDRLGFAVQPTPARFNFDIRPILADRTVGPLALSLLGMKMAKAGWSGKAGIVDECLRLEFHKALGMTDAQFRQWTEGEAVNLDEIEDAKDPDRADSKTFVFRAGHRERKSGDVEKRGHGETAKARLLHNELQNRIHQYLVAVHAEDHVGTEQISGPSRTSIDVVRKTPAGFVFYEIKTSKSLRKCLREAIPQLLEYAFWPEADRAIELVVVSTNHPTKDAECYLALLRKRFGLPVYHETINASTGELSGRI